MEANLNSNEIREVTAQVVEDARPEHEGEINVASIKLQALQAMMIGEIAAQLAEINEKFFPKIGYGSN